MSEFSKILGRFFGRDLIFILSGIIFITILIYRMVPYDKLGQYMPYINDVPSLILIGIVAVALSGMWALGFLLQDIASILCPFFSTSLSKYPSRLDAFLYKRFTQTNIDLRSRDVEYDRFLIYHKAPDLATKFLERVALLKQIGRSIGGALILAVVTKVVLCLFSILDVSYIVIFSLLIFGILFEFVASIKNAQDRVYHMRIADYIRENDINI